MFNHLKSIITPVSVGERMLNAERHESRDD